jgi:hypothetical protein
MLTTVLRMSQEKRTNILITLAGRAADPLRPHSYRRETAISPVAVQPRNNHLTGVHLMGMHITGVHLMAVHLIGVYLMGRVPHGREPHGVCTLWACNS